MTSKVCRFRQAFFYAFFHPVHRIILIDISMAHLHFALTHKDHFFRKLYSTKNNLVIFA